MRSNYVRGNAARVVLIRPSHPGSPALRHNPQDRRRREYETTIHSWGGASFHCDGAVNLLIRPAFVPGHYLLLPNNRLDTGSIMISRDFSVKIAKLVSFDVIGYHCVFESGARA